MNHTGNKQVKDCLMTTSDPRQWLSFKLNEHYYERVKKVQAVVI